MKLTDTKIRNLKPKEKQYKVSDGKNLFLAVTPTEMTPMSRPVALA